METKEIILDGQGLTIEEVVAVARGVDGDYPCVVLGDSARKKITEMRKGIEDLIEQQVTLYGINTGAGINRNEIVPMNNLLGYQRDYILSHCVGSGAPLSKELVRAMMLLRVNSFTFGYSGVTVDLCEKILELLNKDIIPIIPEFGSLGASGDLAPLAHLGAVLIGHQDTMVLAQNREKSTKDVFDACGIKPLKLQPKEAMALTNGSSLMLAYACLAVYDATDLFRIANLTAALNLEAIRGETAAFDERIHKARGHLGQIVAAEDVRAFVDGSQRVTEKARKIHFIDREDKKDWDAPEEPRVQDAYSTRCVPQIHGAFYDALKYLENAVQCEINAATDNPLIFQNEEGGYDVLSGGNFHGDPLAVPLDTLTICLAKIANASNCRQFRLINSAFSFGLPQDLSASKVTKNTGFMIMQYASVGDVLRAAQLSMPASVFSAPTSGMQEDIVSNGTNGAWKNRKVIEYARNVFARELLMVCQAIDLGAEKLGLELSALGKKTDKAYRLIRKYVSMMKQDRYLHADIEEIRKLFVNRMLVKNATEN